MDMIDRCEGSVLRIDGKTVYARRKPSGKRASRLVVRKRHNKRAPKR